LLGLLKEESPNDSVCIDDLLDVFIGVMEIKKGSIKLESLNKNERVKVTRLRDILQEFDPVGMDHIWFRNASARLKKGHSKSMMFKNTFGKFY